MNITFKIQNTDFTVNADGNCFTLLRMGINQDEDSKNYGQQTEVALGYFTNLTNAIDKAVKDRLASYEESVTLKEYVERIEKCTREVRDQLKGI